MGRVESMGNMLVSGKTEMTFDTTVTPITHHVTHHVTTVEKYMTSTNEDMVYNLFQ